jgi:RNA recognition motif-containing protein
MIYVERYPAECTHEQLAAIFRRAANRIKHVSIPRFKESRQGKGFAFIEFHTPEEAQTAVEMFNNTVPREFIDAYAENFIPV